MIISKVKTMKTSQKILLTTVGVAVAFFISSLMILKTNMNEFLDDKNLPEYAVVLEEKFQNLKFSSNWLVRFKQDREYKIAIATPDSIYGPEVKNENGTLIFTRDSMRMDPEQKIRIMITTPIMKKIEGGEHVTLHIQEFSLDTLSISLEDGGKLMEWNNAIEYSTLKTTGEFEQESITDSTD